MDISVLLSFLGASVLLTVLPGPDNILVLTESITKGRREGIGLSLGISSGILVHTLAAVTGLSLIIRESAMAFSVLKYMGALYLLYLAYKALREDADVMKPVQVSSREDKSLFALVKKGFFMNVLNPKVSLFFIAFLPQFTRSNGLSVSVQMLVLGGVFMIQAFVIFSLIALLSGSLSTYMGIPGFWKATKWAKAGILSTLAVVLAWAEK
jgi:threonine/homoserine/homoserine lactone efflux protein